MVFDCDGTLVDSEPLARRAWRDALAPYGYAVTDADLAACLGRSYPYTHAHFAARVQLPAAEELWPAFARRLFSMLDDELVPFADAVETARELAARGVPLAVASSSRRERLERTLARAGLDDVFGVTVAGDEIERGKPAPDMFLAAASRLGRRPGECIAIEDSPPGVAAARAAGMVTIAIARDPGDVAALAEADVVLAELSAAAVLGAAPAARPAPAG